ncbi:DgyrCDS2302 [Dimorphilus gyrociliatus]|uniref:DgyrCDS2302 n=1 Tax=Dimorphilus gyrociliatus TaxID=2664684 RepID=A0A7I8VCY1_9ANNE|nr:DgyrCDS2302 [Dimorphilus gyrociliatus]
MRLLIALIVLSSSLALERKTFEGYKIVKAFPENSEHLQWLNHLKDQNVDFLQPATKEGRQAIMLLNPQQYIFTKTAFDSINLSIDILYDNVERHLQEMWKRLSKKKAFDINDYNSFEDINQGLDDFVGSCPSGASCNIENIGSSTEGRPLRVFKISKSGANRKIVFFDSAIHAREWLAPATNLKLLEAILKQDTQDAINLLNKYDFHFLIIHNPDGYVYSWEVDRFWRKNRSPNAGSFCIGTDLNRNFDVNWGTDGTSTNPCSETYGGSSAASEVETQALQNYAQRVGDSVIVWTSIHTAAQIILHPFGHTENGICVRAEDHDDLYRVANAFADAIENTYDTLWTRGNSCEEIYPTSGSTSDYVKAVVNIKYTYTPELRGPGFNPGKEAIELSSNEIWNGVKAMISEIEAVEKL